MKEQNDIKAPVLFSLEKKQNLNVPDNYFKQLPDELMKIANNEAKTVSFNKKWIYAITIAAAILVGAFIMIPTEKAINKEVIAYNNSFNNLTAEDFEAMMLLEEESDLLASNIDFDDAEEMQFNASELHNTLQTMEITEEDFENYFESEIEDYY